MNNTLKTIALLFFFSSQISASEEITNWEQYFYEEKQKAYQKILSKFPEKSLSESQQDNAPSYFPYKHVEINLTLKEQLTNPILRGTGGIYIHQQSPQLYADVLKKLTDIMNQLPANSYIDFKFIKGLMAIQVRLTKEGIDYLNSRDDVYFELPPTMTIGEGATVLETPLK